MGNLTQDLNKYKKELHTTTELKQGLKIGIKVIGEISGAITVIGASATLLSWLAGPHIGLPITAGLGQKMMIQIARYYPQLGTNDRKKIRAVASFIKGGFSLEKFADR